MKKYYQKNIYVFIYFPLTGKKMLTRKNSNKLQYRTPKKLEINIYGHIEKIFEYISKMYIYTHLVSIEYYLKTYMHLFIVLWLKKICRKVRNSDKLQYTTPRKLKINIYGHNEKPQYRTPKKL